MSKTIFIEIDGKMQMTTVDDSKLQNVKPLLGLVPNYIWQAQRLQAIKNAMGRYAGVDKDIPKEWIDEYIYLNELIN
ncbi:hypothetical protein [Clostridium estertheticum]|uniref:Uncharacterized protein n=1 Tax=Clostridium estertheticum TaxID=238834 RepID=A0AA47I6S9_9CLOT|nr:hypothetical protein [Clostridium estertheticum]MBU3153491.1 hypothetical protein [Clostridium estertheticum]WAG60893.1 hypothetical protein LL038_01175 [Clostridium estertheticum]